MILIAHRGNINGPSADENNPELIRSVWALGYYTEIDVWYIDHQFWLGHDEPTYLVDLEFISDERNWCHAKHFASLQAMLAHNVPHVFSHDQDDFTLTSCGHIWTYPGKELGPASIAVMPELVQDVTTVPRNIFGICSDLVSKLK